MFDLDRVAASVPGWGLEFERGPGDDGVEEVAIFPRLGPRQIFYSWVLYVRKEGFRYSISEPGYVGDMFDLMESIETSCATGHSA